MWGFGCTNFAQFLLEDSAIGSWVVRIHRSRSYRGEGQKKKLNNNIHNDDDHDDKAVSHFLPSTSPPKVT